MTELLAQADPEIIFIIPIVAIVVGGLIAITTMLTHHQRKMAELLRKDAQEKPGLVDEIRAMRGEMADLRDRVNQQTLMLESRPSRPPEVPERLKD
jgi:hypothetical protein